MLRENPDHCTFLLLIQNLFNTYVYTLPIPYFYFLFRMHELPQAIKKAENRTDIVNLIILDIFLLSIFRRLIKI